MRISNTETPLISALRGVCEKYPRDEKVLITPDYRVGQQVLQALARSGTPWMNFRIAAVSSLAHDAAEEEIISAGLRQVSGAGILAIIDDIFNGLADSKKLKYFEKHQTNSGIIHALTGVITELRTKGISPEETKNEDLINADKAHDLKLIRTGYENFLKKNGIIDKAGLVMLALDSLKKSPPMADKKYVIFSRYYMTGLERKFIRVLASGRLLVAEDGPVFGLNEPKGIWPAGNDAAVRKTGSDTERLSWLFACGEAPAPKMDGVIEMFRAAGFRNEIREIFRRVAAGSIPLDQVEIVYADPSVYVREISCLCEKLDLPATFSEGVPGNTRSSYRSIKGFLKWIEHDFMELYLRRMLEAGDIRLKGDREEDISSGPILGHLLRTSGVGWGRGRYGRVLQKTAEGYARMACHPSNDEEAERKEEYGRAAKNTEKLNWLCRELLHLVPEIDENGKVDLPELCEGCAAFLREYARVEGPRDEMFISDATTRIDMIGKFGARKMDIAEAVEKLAGTVSAVKIGSSGPRPGHIHVSHYKHGGRSARPNTFVVGLDEIRFPGRGMQDPVLLDVERKRISEDMEVSSDKINKNVYDMASMFAGLRGRVTASYSSFNIKEERKVFPSALMLQLYRLKEGNPDADYDAMARGIGTPVSIVSAGDKEMSLDATEWWVRSLAEDGVLKDGTCAVQNVYLGVEAGLKAAKARESGEFTGYDGKIVPAGGELDPRENRDLVLSCSKLEKAALCPFKYFLANVLCVEKPEETIRDAVAWLDAMRKGSLLHEVFEHFTKELRENKRTLPVLEQKKLIREILGRVAGKYRDEVPPPSEVVYEGECVQLERDTDIFIDINERLKTKTVLEELGFGTAGQPPVSIPLGEGREIFLRGFIDRIDSSGEHEYHVWDYKTGSAYKYDRKQYLAGGEQLQHALYAQAAETLLRAMGRDDFPVVTRSGYLLSSEKGAGDGKGSIFGRDPSNKETWRRALNTLFDLISNGAFLAVPDETRCSFCDYSVICCDKKAKERFKSKRDSGDRYMELWKELKSYE